MLSERVVLVGVGEFEGAGVLVGAAVPVGVGGPLVSVGVPRHPASNPKAQITANNESRY